VEKYKYRFFPNQKDADKTLDVLLNPILAAIVLVLHSFSPIIIETLPITNLEILAIA
jgi:hypothetical protein